MGADSQGLTESWAEWILKNIESRRVEFTDMGASPYELGI